MQKTRKMKRLESHSAPQAYLQWLNDLPLGHPSSSIALGPSLHHTNLWGHGTSKQWHNCENHNSPFLCLVDLPGVRLPFALPHSTVAPFKLAFHLTQINPHL